MREMLDMLMGLSINLADKAHGAFYFLLADAFCPLSQFYDKGRIESSRGSVCQRAN